jgi:hypothetical protein
LMNGETDNDCEQNCNARADCNFFPSFHDSRHCLGDLSPQGANSCHIQYLHKMARLPRLG